MKVVSRTVAIREYFFPGRPAQEVIAEMKKLTEADKQELSEGAAKELGYELEVKPA